MRLIVPDVCDRTRYTSEKALKVARTRFNERPSYDLEVFDFLARYLNSSEIDLNVVERTLEILTEITSPEKLFSILRLAMENTDPHVRSKSALSLGRRLESLPLLQKLATDHDPRVRANTVEALWGRCTPDIVSVFDQAARDPHHRVAANAIYGLYLVDPHKHLPDVANLSKHAEPGHRAAAAWLVGKIGDRRNGAILKPLISDADPAVRRMAFSTISTLRSAHASAA